MLSSLSGRTSQPPDPIFIIGVPRSGTTLLRVLLDSHPNIACGPESPWLARMPSSVKRLYQFMCEDEFGYVKNFGVEREILRRQVADWVNNLYMAYAEKRGKKRWGDKTPDNSLEISFLSELFPDACFVFIVRDGRDVACSTAILSDERKKISPWHSENILLDDGHVIPNTLQNAALRWKQWNERIERSIQGLRHLMLRYEDLIGSPRQELERLTAFIGESYDSGMLEYVKHHHDYPAWEWGSYDVKKSVGITDMSVARWKTQLTHEDLLDIERAIGPMLLKYGYGLHDDPLRSENL